MLTFYYRFQCHRTMYDNFLLHSKTLIEILLMSKILRIDVLHINIRTLLYFKLHGNKSPYNMFHYYSGFL